MFSFIIFCLHTNIAEHLGWLTCVLQLLVAGLAVAVMGLAVAFRGNVNASAVGVALVNILVLGEGLEALVSAYTQLETSIGAVARIQEYLSTTPQEAGSGLAENAGPEGGRGPAAIQFDDVVASYGYAH